MSTKLKVHITISNGYLRRCLKSRNFIRLAATYNIVVKLPADPEKYKIVISCPGGHDREAAEIRLVVESVLGLQSSAPETCTEITHCPSMLRTLF